MRYKLLHLLSNIYKVQLFQGLEEVPQLVGQNCSFPIQISRVCPSGCQWQQRVCRRWIHEPGDPSFFPPMGSHMPPTYLISIFFLPHISHPLQHRLISSHWAAYHEECPPCSQFTSPHLVLTMENLQVGATEFTTIAQTSLLLSGGTAPALGNWRLGGTCRSIPAHTQASRGRLSLSYCLLPWAAQPGGVAASEGGVQGGHAAVWVHLGGRRSGWQMFQRDAWELFSGRPPLRWMQPSTKKNSEWGCRCQSRKEGEDTEEVLTWRGKELEKCDWCWTAHILSLKATKLSSISMCFL